MTHLGPDDELETEHFDWSSSPITQSPREEGASGVLLFSQPADSPRRHRALPDARGKLQEAARVA